MPAPRLTAHDPRVVVPCGAHGGQADVPGVALERAVELGEREQRRPLPRPEGGDQRVVLRLQVATRPAFHDPDDRTGRDLLRPPAPIGQDDLPAGRGEADRQVGLGALHLALETEQRVVGLGPGSLTARKRTSAPPTRTVTGSPGVQAPAGHEHPVDDVLPERRPAVGADRARREGPEQPVRTPAALGGEQPLVDPAHAVHEPDRSLRGGLRAPGNGPVPRLGRGVHARGGLIEAGLEAHPVVRCPRIGPQRQHARSVPLRPTPQRSHPDATLGRSGIVPGPRSDVRIVIPDYPPSGGLRRTPVRADSPNSRREVVGGMLGNLVRRERRVLWGSLSLVVVVAIGGALIAASSARAGG